MLVRYALGNYGPVTKSNTFLVVAIGTPDLEHGSRGEFMRALMRRIAYLIIADCGVC